MSENYYEPFEHAEEVWFWFCSSMVARIDGWRTEGGNFGGRERGCETTDIQRIVKAMRFHHKVTNRHLRVMFKWGEMMTPPYYDKRAKASEVRLWAEGMSVLKVYLIGKGIIDAG